MELPESGADEIKKIPETNERYIKNPRYGQEFLTQFEAIDMINILSGMLMADFRYRGDFVGRRTG